MNWTPERLLIIGLSVLLLISILIILKLYRERKPSDNVGGSYVFVSQEKHKEVLKERDRLRDELEKRGGAKDITPVYNELQEKYERACVDIVKLNCRIDELTRDKNELNELYKRDSVPDNLVKKAEGTNSAVAPVLRNEMLQEKKGWQVIMYASFPRSAGSTIYFSDLTDKLADDSYFELKVSNDTGKASFKPLDFMKIRNYDPAMAAILTDGVKPNVASTVVSVEPGDAYLEGNDWIIKKLVKIKLA